MAHVIVIEDLHLAPLHAQAALEEVCVRRSMCAADVRRRVLVGGEIFILCWVELSYCAGWNYHTVALVRADDCNAALLWRPAAIAFCGARDGVAGDACSLCWRARWRGSEHKL